MFFDVLERDALDGMPVLIAATAGTARHSLTLEHAIRPLFTYFRAITAPTGVFAAPEDWAAADAATGALSDRITRAAGEFAELLMARSLAPANKELTDPFADPTPFEELLNRR